MLRSTVESNYCPPVSPSPQDMPWCCLRNSSEGISGIETTKAAVLTDMWQPRDVRIWNNQKELINSLIFLVVNIKVSGFWEVKPCSLVHRYQCYVGICCQIPQNKILRSKILVSLDAILCRLANIDWHCGVVYRLYTQDLPSRCSYVVSLETSLTNKKPHECLNT
jgi:hypothetical protein